MVAAHHATGRTAARSINRGLTVVRHMTPPPAADRPQLLNWGVMLTNAVGVVIGLALTASVGGVVFLVYRLPAQQDQILHRLEESKSLIRDLASEVERLEKNDRVQDDRILRIEEGRPRR